MVEKPHLVSCLGLASGLPVSHAVVSPLTPGLFLDALPCHPEWGQLEAALQVPSRVPACTRTRVSLRPPPASAGHSQQSVTACTEQRQGKGDGQKGNDGVARREVMVHRCPFVQWEGVCCAQGLTDTWKGFSIGGISLLCYSR